MFLPWLGLLRTTKGTHAVEVGSRVPNAQISIDVSAGLPPPAKAWLPPLPNATEYAAGLKDTDAAAALPTPVILLPIALCVAALGWRVRRAR